MLCSQFSVAEESYGIATSVFGVCAKKQNSHVFQVDAPLISKNMRETFHGLARAKTFLVNYQLAAEIQAMGCGSTDVATLVAFLNLPASWSTVTSHMKQCEKVMGPIQICWKIRAKKIL